MGKSNNSRRGVRHGQRSGEGPQSANARRHLNRASHLHVPLDLIRTGAQRTAVRSMSARDATAAEVVAVNIHVHRR